MGNCINREAVVSWAEVEEDSAWVDFRNKDDQKLEDEDWSSVERRRSESDVKPANVKVKIKVTKKQLEYLLGSVNSGALPVRELLDQLLTGVGDDVGIHSWRPTLQSIPETTESS